MSVVNQGGGSSVSSSTAGVNITTLNGSGGGVHVQNISPTLIKSDSVSIDGSGISVSSIGEKNHVYILKLKKGISGMNPGENYLLWHVFSSQGVPILNIPKDSNFYIQENRLYVKNLDQTLTLSYELYDCHINLPLKTI